jgi:hypothetical protein
MAGQSPGRLGGVSPLSTEGQGLQIGTGAWDIIFAQNLKVAHSRVSRPEHARKDHGSECEKALNRHHRQAGHHDDQQPAQTREPPTQASVGRGPGVSVVGTHWHVG